MDEVDDHVVDPEVGDELTVVVIHPNRESSRDPAAKVNGKTSYIRFPEDINYDPIFAEIIDVRIADIQEHNLLLVPQDPEKYREETEVSD